MRIHDVILLILNTSLRFMLCRFNCIAYGNTNGTHCTLRIVEVQNGLCYTESLTVSRLPDVKTQFHLFTISSRLYLVPRTVTAPPKPRLGGGGSSKGISILNWKYFSRYICATEQQLSILPQNISTCSLYMVVVKRHGVNGRGSGLFYHHRRGFTTNVGGGDEVLFRPCWYQYHGQQSFPS